ncbi:MAG TPA: EscU/YscU/HrcU family type III secretion system export apparatus switch protein [Bryobacteraceae bacterium]|nr:EscU/YscU/HrcU family type III secretion system export apparatus switch protein [Bryobacteraceae bacterium]
MAEQKTEQPTQGRLQKTRKEGRFPVSRDFIAALQLATVFIVFLSYIEDLWRGSTVFISFLFRQAFSSNPLTAGRLVQIYDQLIFPGMLNLLRVGGMIVLLVLLIQLSSNGFGLAVKQLAPDVKRLNFFSRAKQLPMENLTSTVRAALLIPAIAYVLLIALRGEESEISNLAAGGLMAGIAHAGSLVKQLLWQLTTILVVLGLVDLFRQRHKFRSDLKMTKQEVRDEMKETEGNPQMKVRIRRLQREAARRSMMKAVPKATAIVVNPTHYAVALRYEMDSRSVPAVVAKGKNFLAQLIRERATAYDIPVIENKPLAQALYHSVDVGQEIPPNLYRAVAEVLAHIYRTLNRR